MNISPSASVATPEGEFKVPVGRVIWVLRKVTWGYPRAAVKRSITRRRLAD
jgi:hypothetical protein